VVRPGGSIAAYAWDLLDGGFPWEPVHEEFRAIGFSPPLAPRAEAGRIGAMRQLWQDAGLESVETRVITVERAFVDFDDFWETATLSPTMLSILPAIEARAIDGVKDRLRARLPGADGRVVLTARANAARGVVPR
jgi:hypothetical protein